MKRPDTTGVLIQMHRRERDQDWCIVQSWSVIWVKSSEIGIVLRARLDYGDPPLIMLASGQVAMIHEDLFDAVQPG